MKNHAPRDASAFTFRRRLGGALAALIVAIGSVSSSRAGTDGRKQPIVVQRDTLAGAALIKRGEYLARAGDCVACHTADKGRPFAGGLPITTPFGTIYTPNITSDPDTGIGRWTDADFLRAMHEGIGKGGERLYPAFPYAEYTKVTDYAMSSLSARI